MRIWEFGAVLLASCLEPSEQDQRITDQAGGVFFWSCGKRGGCEVHRISGESPPMPECDGFGEPYYGANFDHFGTITAFCSTPMGGSPWDISRAIVCESDDECPDPPTNEEHAPLECRAGLCQSTDLDAYPPSRLRADELELLCMGDAPHFTDRYPDAALDEALNAACPGRITDRFVECVSVPDGCPDPR